jgi:hypothetical protein
MDIHLYCMALYLSLVHLLRLFQNCNTKLKPYLRSLAYIPWHADCSSGLCCSLTLMNGLLKLSPTSLVKEIVSKEA